MTRLYQCGFEWQSVASGVEFATADGNLSVETTIKHSGAASCKLSGSIAASAIGGFTHTVTSTATFYVSFWIYISAMDDDANETLYCDFYNAANNATSLAINRSGATYTATMYWNNWGASSATTFTITTGAWHQIQIFYDTSPADGAEDIIVKMDGVEKINETSLTLTRKTITSIQWGVYNGSAGALSGATIYWDDIAINSSAGTVNNSWPENEEILIAVPNAAGDNAATAGLYSYINEIPPSDTCTASGTDCIELDTTTSIGDYNITDTATLGINSYDYIRAISVLGRVREESAGTSNYTLRIKSAASGTVAASSSVDAGNATVRTNPSSTTAFGAPLISETDPTTGLAWTPTGTNSLENAQIGAATTDGAPDIWVAALCAMIAIVRGTAPVAVPRHGFVNFQEPGVM